MTVSRTKAMALVGIMSAVICILGPLTVPIGAVPVSLANLAMLLAAYLLGAYKGGLAVAVYLLMGLIGLPVFSGFGAGVAKIAGPTGGYLIGYIPMAVIAGYFAHRWQGSRLMAALGMALGTLVLYALGTAWLAIAAHLSFGAALAAGVAPFVVFDGAKIALVALLGPQIRKPLVKMGYLE